MYQVQKISLIRDKLIPHAVFVASCLDGQAVVDFEHAVLEEG